LTIEIARNGDRSHRLTILAASTSIHLHLFHDKITFHNDEFTILHLGGIELLNNNTENYHSRRKSTIQKIDSSPQNCKALKMEST